MTNILILFQQLHNPVTFTRTNKIRSMGLIMYFQVSMVRKVNAYKTNANFKCYICCLGIMVSNTLCSVPTLFFKERKSF